MASLTPTVVVLVVGLTERLIGPSTPRLRAFAARGAVCGLEPPFPAVTCTAQSAMLTGEPASVHGIVGNGWYEREQDEVRFWKQSSRLVRAPKVWEVLRERAPGATTANLFWWFNMATTADIAVTPRPIYTADGRKIPDCAAEPPGLRDELQAELGAFPLFRFWGPGASIESSRWIASASIRVMERFAPDLTLVYLPHLDYALQKHGPDGAEASRAASEVDAEFGRVLDAADRRGARVLVVSEYAIEPVDRPVAINRALREAGLLRVRAERGGELLDTGGSEAFAVADHQAAHVYVAHPGRLTEVASLCAGIPGVASVLDREGRRAVGLDHERAGDLVLVASSGSWFTPDWWLDPARAPDFARTVEIHRKPGYDPRELFIDPRIRFPALAIGRRLLAKRLGFRTLMDVIPLDPTLVRGSHGRTGVRGGERPVLIGEGVGLVGGEVLGMASVRDVILRSVLGGG